MAPALIFENREPINIDSPKIMFRDKNHNVFIGENKVGQSAYVSGMRSNGPPYLITPSSEGIKIRVNESTNEVKHYGPEGNLLNESKNETLIIPYGHCVEIGFIEFSIGK